MAEDVPPQVAHALVVADNVAIQIEKSLYKLVLALDGPGFKKITQQISVIWNPIRNALSSILPMIEKFITPLLDRDVLAAIKDVVEAGRDLVGSALDLLEDKARALVTNTKKFLDIMVDFVSAGLDHLSAIVDLLLNLGYLLTEKSLNLKPETLDALKNAGVLVLPAVTVEVAEVLEVAEVSE